MNTDYWTLRDWILRGLVMSCLSQDRLFAWYTERVRHPVGREVFDVSFARCADDGLVYVQRQVPGNGGWVDGWSLTERGMELEPIAMARRRQRHDA